jgi:hypothetical protein
VLSANRLRSARNTWPKDLGPAMRDSASSHVKVTRGGSRATAWTPSRQQLEIDGET